MLLSTLGFRTQLWMAARYNGYLLRSTQPLYQTERYSNEALTRTHQLFKLIYIVETTKIVTPCLTSFDCWSFANTSAGVGTLS